MSDDSKQVAPAAKRRPPAAGMGRKKGATNKVPREVKTMVLQALDKAGGVTYLVARAKDPKTAPAFLALVGKVLPLQITGADGRTLAQELAGLNAAAGRDVARDE